MDYTDVQSELFRLLEQEGRSSLDAIGTMLERHQSDPSIYARLIASLVNVWKLIPSKIQYARGNIQLIVLPFPIFSTTGMLPILQTEPTHCILAAMHLNLEFLLSAVLLRTLAFPMLPRLS